MPREVDHQHHRLTEWTTPSQAEGEREEDVVETRSASRAASARHPDVLRTTPSQAEGERDEGE